LKNIESLEKFIGIGEVWTALAKKQRSHFGSWNSAAMGAIGMFP